MSIEDELARTATAPGNRVGEAATAPATPSALAAPARATLGRYRLQAVLGEGGMGVVHAAFDPELERKIALKVLRSAGTDDARARLLREARALAKLSHPHVITVYDVGSVDGEDFIAMELVVGTTLGDWVRDDKPSPRAIIAAFVAAGRGLAAAHAEGLVHRDFKPSNVLRSKAGKILVTDFGLARTAGADAAVSAAASDSVITTKTGAIVGTPAYMAPEQWSGGTVTPATDQFAFCVALWEALAGERPFRGETFEELRTGVLAGPAQLDADAIARPLRAILRRGLAVDPSARWPSMDALLVALERYAHRRRRWVVAIGITAAAAAAAISIVSTRSTPGTRDDCAPAALDPYVAWSPFRSGLMQGRDPGAAALVEQDVATWRSLRSRVCTAPGAQQAAKLACLDATLARLDAIVGSALADGGAVDADVLAAGLVDPAMCDRPSPPRLTQLTPELIAAFTLRRHAEAGRPPASADELALADRATTPCGRAVALTARVENLDEREIPVHAAAVFRDLASAADGAAHCDDDPIRSELAIEAAGQRGAAGAADVEATVAAFPQVDLRGELEEFRAMRARAAERWDEAETAFARAIELYGERRRVRNQVQVVRAEISGLLDRGRAEDIARVRQLLATWLPIARGLFPKAQLDEVALRLRWQLGDVRGADAEAEELRARGRLTDFVPPMPVPGSIAITGEVVDASGRPVANADVVATPMLIGDSASIASPVFAHMRTATRTGPDGTFELKDTRGFVAAQAGTLRSSVAQPAGHIHLVIQPTSHLDGTVELGDTPATRLWVVVTVKSAHTTIVAPIGADRTFHVDGVPRGVASIGVARLLNYDVGGAAVQLAITNERHAGVVLAVSTHTLYIIGRSSGVTPPDGGLFFVFEKFDPGPHPTLRSIKKQPVENGLYAQAADVEHLPKVLVGNVQADDVLVTVPDRPTGALVVCGIGFSKQQLAGAASLKEFGEGMADMDLGCAPIAPDQQIVTVDLPPLRKLSPSPAKQLPDRPAP